ncbi:rho GTPase-activating protein 2-like [Impatiens glandulifera]|uniref:rho GTPase-activating protein 2-like n=1 Tax=Impatiens glandulifera TaxID=253017 RepID=UPI001FB0DD8D|nr:rho GTPase-activating protein 2-like [Impatiens glandulifera]
MTGVVMVTKVCGGGGMGSMGKGNHHAGGGGGSRVVDGGDQDQNHQQLSIVAFLITALRKSMVSCRIDRTDEEVISTVRSMEIGWPTNVQHITHVTFDRFQGFLGLPVEFEVEVPCKVPSASINVFGVSAESMQCSYDSRGNSVPTILLLMQDKLYTQGGLKAEGIFRINPENSQQEQVRSQLNRGIVPENIDVHCLAGLIKAWFRELPSGVLDGLSPEQVLQCNNEDDSVELVKQLKPTESALLNWSIDLMADVVEQEEFNKMKPRNVAMVFAPNMTQMSDPLTALMHAVQVMNLLRTLIIRTLRDREDAASSNYSSSCSSSSAEEMEMELEMDCELRGPPLSEFEADEEDEVEVEEHFLRQFDGNVFEDNKEEDLKITSIRTEDDDEIDMVNKIEEEETSSSSITPLITV